MEIWHVLNRGVEKRKICMDLEDHLRFVHDLYVFNDIHDVDANHRFKKWTSDVHISKREPLVDIHAWSLMPNHYHLLISETKEGHMPLFLKKINMGYAKYFNEKYKRSGALWQGKTRKILIERDAHYMYIPYYIHLNALDLSMPEWREGMIKNPRKALEELKKYRWSSHLDYLGEKNFPSLIHRETLKEHIGSKTKYERTIAEIIGNSQLSAHSQALE